MKKLVPIVLLVLISVPSFAKHIIGGVLTYECLGGGNYRFTMKMYRDCSDPTGAGFDFGAPFSIYKGSDPVPIETLFLSPDVITGIDPEDNPCLELPPNVCVQEGIYVFEYQFTDWPSTESYHVTYQRCCRNATVTNIKTPGDVGATFTVELTAKSQEFCNNSPVFNAFPPIVVCANYPLVFDHSAVDAEGDQLVYEFCAPLIGGGMNTSPNNCDQIVPNPACPPPYETVDFVNPPYSFFDPMGGSPPISINSSTGLITGTPTTMGQFSVAVCVSEYRNGVLLSRIMRDFQFNVGDCEPTINADINADNLVLENGQYLIRNCADPLIKIENESTLQSNIDNFQWQFYVGDSTWVYNTWDVSVNFPGPGSYQGILALNPGSQCGDTAQIFIDIFPRLVAAFGYDYDTCVAGPVSFMDQSFIDGIGQIVDWRWDLGDGTKDTLQRNPVHVYGSPQVVLVNLEVEDSHGCTDDTTRAVTYKPVPALILVKPNDTVSCAPAAILFNNLSSPIDLYYDVHWDFGDGETGDAISPVHTYERPGIYSVKLEITSPIGCSVDTFFENLVEILSPPIADFFYSPTDPTNLNPTVDFTDRSIDAVHWDWIVNGQLVSQQQDFSYTFPDTGLQVVSLAIVHPENCLDTLTREIDVKPVVTFHMPNAFTPNEDTVNDLFMGNGILIGISDYKMEVWDRWGGRIFETADPSVAWNGRVKNTGRAAPAGIYPYTVRFTGPRGEPFEFKGLATLIR
ncbi:MAG: gliding motility-associated C-terminal domain-containing protein [Lewinellaceae bacterium]|nr:gliding motility-associated C-terminal domain-containing protein [Saprospiraceae bacterium]MCB9336762.1 gliding motility-associated C-terminal domain-containing protein [Lewinellaceae bacterium]